MNAFLYQLVCTDVGRSKFLNSFRLCTSVPPHGMCFPSVKILQLLVWQSLNDLTENFFFQCFSFEQLSLIVYLILEDLILKPHHFVGNSKEVGVGDN